MTNRPAGKSSFWMVAAGVVAVLATVGLGAGIWFFVRQGVEEGDKWASVLALGLAYVVAMAGLVLFLARERGGNDGNDQPPSDVRIGRDGYLATNQYFDQRGRDGSEGSDR